MAHTLTLTNISGTALDLASTGSSAGYKLKSYRTGDAQPQVTYNASIYNDSDKPVFSRFGNAIDTITVDIFGSSRDDALDKLGALKAAVWNARQAIQNPDMAKLAYLSFKPDSSTNTAYAIIMGGVVTEPDDFLDTNYLDSKILNVSITIERETYWRSKTPVRSTTLTDFSTAVLTGQAVTPQWTSTQITSVQGRVPAPILMTVLPTSSGTFDQIVMSYTSELYNPFFYNLDPIIEAEGMTTGTDASGATDATASPGGGGTTKIKVTFATSSNQIRLSGYTIRVGAYRVWARMAVQSSTTVSAYLAYADSGTYATAIANAPVSVTSTSWQMYDLGVVKTPIKFGLYRTASTLTYVNLYASRSAGSGELWIDFLYMMPLESYVHAKSVGASAASSVAYLYDNLTPWATANHGAINNSTFSYYGGYGSGQIKLPPGNGRLSYFTMSSANVNSLTANPTSWSMYYVPQFPSARGDDG